MIVAAAAAEEDAPELLSEIVDGERLELADFHDRLLERLVDAAAQDELAARRARRAPGRLSRTSRAVAAVAAVAAVLGVSRISTTPEVQDNRLALATATQQYADLSSAVVEDSPGGVTEAAAELHETLETLITDHATDPEVAQRAATLLQAEISMLENEDPDGARHVIAQARSLITLLRRAVPASVRPSVAPILDAVPTPSPTHKPTPKPSATTAKPSPSSTPKATPTPKSSTTAAPDGEDDSPLHAAP
jgi:hypothetical protein